MTGWEQQIKTLIEPCLAASKVTDVVRIGPGVIGETGHVASQLTDARRALIMADDAGFAAAGAPVVASLEAAGFEVETLVLQADPLPAASVEEAEPFRAALAADPTLFPVSVGSGVINDLVKYAAFETDRRYLTVATAASMDGYTSAGAPLARGGFKVTIPVRAPVAMIADLGVITAAPAEMNGWGFGDLAGKIPAGGDWILADLVGAEPIDDRAWSLVQDTLVDWLSNPAGIPARDQDTVARLFVGLTAVGFAMEFHGSSRPASGADHQIAHLWEMEGHTHGGRKVSHGAAVAIGAVAALALFDWLLAQDLSGLDAAAVAARAPDLATREAALLSAIPDPNISPKALEELRAKHVDQATLEARLTRITAGWTATRARLADNLVRQSEMVEMLRAAGSPAFAADIGVGQDHLMSTIRAAAFIRRRYTILDFLHETGLTEDALAAVAPKLVDARRMEKSA
ncbi:MAG: iron-containing alcohol dehydrogenase [Pseudomonadota bacterium]